jgi:hypothetical protein
MASNGRKSAFQGLGFKKVIRSLFEEIQALYTADTLPWNIGYRPSRACEQRRAAAAR